MNEYNERILKNVLEDYIEENDEQLSKEIEEAKNDPRFQVKEGEARAFAMKHYKAKSKKKKTASLILKIASVVLIIAIGVSFIPFSVEGKRSSFAEIIINFVNTEFLSLDSDESESLLLTYQGEFIPAWIPEGYIVESVNNSDEIKVISFTNNNNCKILFKEQLYNVKTNLNYENGTNKKDITVLDYNGIYYEKDNVQYISVITDSIILTVTCDDNNVDIIGFVNKIEKR